MPNPRCLRIAKALLRPASEAGSVDWPGYDSSLSLLSLSSLYYSCFLLDPHSPYVTSL